MASNATIENDYYSRLCKLLIDCGTIVLQDVLEMHLSKLYKYCPLIRKGTCSPTTCSVGQSGNHLSFSDVLNFPGVNNIMSSSVSVLLGKDQKQLLSAGKVSVVDLDITLSSLLLRNICGLKISKDKIWNNPSQTDTSTEGRIARVRILRNKVYGHRTSTSITKQTFDQYWDDITRELIPLSSTFNQDDYNAQRSVPVDVGMQEKYNRLLDSWCRQIQAIDELKDEVQSYKVEIEQQIEKLPTGKDLENLKTELTTLIEKIKETNKIALNSELIAQMDNICEHHEKISAAQTEDITGSVIKAIDQLGLGPNVKRAFCEEATETKDECDVLHVDSLTENLKSHYIRNSAVTPLLWNESFKLMLDKTYTTLTITDKQTEIDVNNIFDPMYSKACPDPNRVLVEGNAGTGKTTLCKKLAFNWAQWSTSAGNPYGMNRFKMVFLLKARFLTGNLVNDISSQLLPKDFPLSKDDLWQLITRHQKHVLFILDGYDELKKEFHEQVIDLLQGKILSNASVIVTSRRGYLSEFSTFHTFLSNEGFSLKQACNFVSMYIQNCAKTKEIEGYILDLLKVNRCVRELSKTPLALIFIIILLEDNYKIRDKTMQFSTIGQLYHDLVVCVIKGYCQKTGIKYTEEFSKNLSCRLGNIALQGLEENNVVYKNKDIDANDSDLIDCGFIVHDKSDSVLDPEDIFFFIHFSFLEFFAAFKIYHDPLSYTKYENKLLEWTDVLSFVVSLSFSYNNLSFIRKIIMDSPTNSITQKNDWRCCGFAHTKKTIFKDFTVTQNLIPNFKTDIAATYCQLWGTLLLCHRLCPVRLYGELIDLLSDKIPERLAIVNPTHEDEIKNYISLVKKCNVKNVCCLVYQNLELFKSEELHYLQDIVLCDKLDGISVQVVLLGNEVDICKKLIANLVYCKNVQIHITVKNENSLQWLCKKYFTQIRRDDSLNLIINNESGVRSGFYGDPNFFRRYHGVVCVISSNMAADICQAIQHIKRKSLTIEYPLRELFSLFDILGCCGALVVFRIESVDSDGDTSDLSAHSYVQEIVRLVSKCTKVKRLAFNPRFKCNSGFIQPNQEHVDQLCQCLNRSPVLETVEISLFPNIPSESEEKIKRVCAQKKINLSLEICDHVEFVENCCQVVTRQCLLIPT